MSYQTTLSDDGAGFDVALAPVDSAKRAIAEAAIDAARVIFLAAANAAVADAIKPDAGVVALLMCVTSAGKPQDLAKITESTGIAFECVPQFTWDKTKHRAEFTIDGVKTPPEVNPRLASFGNSGDTFTTRTFKAGEHAAEVRVFDGSQKIAFNMVAFTVQGAVIPPEPPPTTTGRPSKSTTQPTGTLTTQPSTFKAESNKTYQSMRFVNDVDLRNLTNVKFINCEVDSQNANPYCFRCDDGNTSPTARVFERCELKNMNSCGVYGGGFTAKDCYVHHSAGDGFKPTHDAVIQGCYVTMLGMSEGSHADGVQLRGAKNVKIMGNFFDMPTGVAGTSSNACVFCQKDTDGTKPSNIAVANNFCLGGNYSVQLLDSGANCAATGNTFYAGSVRYGFGRLSDNATWSGNKTSTGTNATPQMK